MFLLRIPLLLIILSYSMTTHTFATPQVSYVLGFSNPHTHYVEVEMTISGIEKSHFVKGATQSIEVSLPVWTPGSYLVREYARHVEQLQSFNDKSEPLICTKSTKNTWKISTCGSKLVKIKYLVYAFDLTVRTSYVDEYQAYMNGASIFCFYKPALNFPCEVQINKPSQWAKVVTALKQVSGKTQTWQATNYDELVDSPILVGNPDVFSFEASGVNHTVAMVGNANYDVAKLKLDMASIVKAATEVIGTHPCQDYTFIIHNLATGGGGLEHSHSTSLLVNRNTYSNEKDYYNFLSLVAHEYFHLWNVKRIRPIELGPFNYHEEVYCSQLWTVEGWTSYYDDFIMYRAGLSNEEKFFDVICSNMNYVINGKGNQFQSLSDASFDAWIKYYRPTENSPNSATNYYTKGAVASLALDLAILQSTQGKANLDDLLKLLWKDYYLEKNRGFTASELENAMQKVAKINLKPLLDRWVHSTEAIDLQALFSPVGLLLINKNDGQFLPTIGATISNQNGKFIVTQTIRDYPAFKEGLYVNDEILTVDNQRLTAEFSSMLIGKKAGDMVHLLVSRKNGELRQLSLPVVPDQQVSYKLVQDPKATPAQQKLQHGWLRKKV